MPEDAGGTTNFHCTFINNGSVLNAGLRRAGVLVDRRANEASATQAGTVRISNVTRVGNDVLIQVRSATGFTYRLQLTPSLQLPAWTDSGPAQPGTGGVLTFTDPGAATNALPRFYRVRVE